MGHRVTVSATATKAPTPTVIRHHNGHGFSTGCSLVGRIALNLRGDGEDQGLVRPFV